MSKHKKTEPLPKSLHEAVSQPARSPQMRIKRKERQRRKKEIGTGKFRVRNFMNGKSGFRCLLHPLQFLHNIAKMRWTRVKDSVER